MGAMGTNISISQNKRSKENEEVISSHFKKDRYNSREGKIKRYVLLEAALTDWGAALKGYKPKIKGDKTTEELQGLFNRYDEGRMMRHMTPSSIYIRDDADYEAILGTAKKIWEVFNSHPNLELRYITARRGANLRMIFWMALERYARKLESEGE